HARNVTPVSSDPKRWLSAEIERTIQRYPSPIDFGSSNDQNADHSERARIRRCLLRNRWMCNMYTDLSYATGRSSRTIRFVLVNNRVPLADRHCALCNRLMEKGYVRDSQTRLIYCDTWCCAGSACETTPVVKNRRRQVS